MRKGIIMSISNTCNPVIPNQYNVKIALTDQDELQFVYLDVRNVNFIKIAKRGMKIMFSESFEVSKNRFIHTQEIRVMGRDVKTTFRRNK